MFMKIDKLGILRDEEKKCSMKEKRETAVCKILISYYMFSVFSQGERDTNTEAGVCTRKSWAIELSKSGSLQSLNRSTLGSL